MVVAVIGAEVTTGPQAAPSVSPAGIAWRSYAGFAGLLALLAALALLIVRRGASR
jgi:hypothetical protein